MSSLSEKAMIKTQLLNTMQQLNLHEQLKKHLRIQLCQKLKQKDLIQPSPSAHFNSLFSRVMASLISEQMVLNGCEYSNSIFAVQSGYDMKLLNRQEMMEIIGIDQKQIQKSKSILNNILTRRHPFSQWAAGSSQNGERGLFRNIAVQAGQQQIGYTLEQRLTLIDQEYRNNLKISNNKQQIDYKRKLQVLQAQLKRTYERDLERFKQFQSHAIKVQVSQQWRKKFQEYAEAIQNEYRVKYGNLRKKQNLLTQSITNKTKSLDIATQSLTKSFQQKLDALDLKSQTLEQTKANVLIQQKNLQEQHKQLQSSLRAKKMEYDSLLLNLQEKIKYEVNLAKVSLQQEHQEKNADFLARKKVIDQQYGKIMTIKDMCDLVQKQNSRLHQENLKIREQLGEVEKEIRTLVAEKSNYGQRVDQLRGEINRFEKEKLIRDESLRQAIKKCKKREEQITELRRELDELRLYKERKQIQLEGNQSRNSIENSSIVDDPQNDDEHQAPRKPPQKNSGSSSGGPSSISGTEAAAKLEQLRQQRRKQIQRLKMQM